MKTFIQDRTPSKPNFESSHYDRELGTYILDPKRVDYAILGKLKEGSHIEHAYQDSRSNRLGLTIIDGNENRYIWGVSEGEVTSYKQRYDREERRWTTDREKSRSYRWSLATSEYVTSYRNIRYLRGLNYVSRDRGIWNPLYDDRVAKLVEFSENTELQEWLTACYIKMRPDLKSYFEGTMPHTPPMAELAFKYPGFRVFIVGGWVPTFPFSHNRGIFRSVLNQPNPKRMLNYIYGSHSKDNFKHMKSFMGLRNNWFIIMAARIGRKHFPGEWIKELALTEQDAYPNMNGFDVSNWRIGSLEQAFSDVKKKRLLSIFQDAARSTDNMELFFDTFRMGSSLRHRYQNNEPIDVWSAFGTSHIDEIHTRTIALYNERYRGNRYGYLGSGNWKPEDKLKPAKELLEIQDHRFGENLKLRVAETACEVADWGAQQEHCIASYIPMAKKGATSLLGIYRNNMIYANVSVSNGMITQLRGKQNRRIDPNDEILIKNLVTDAFASPGNSSKKAKIPAHA